MSRLMTTVLKDVEELYFRDTEPAELIAAGFSHLEETHPEIDFAREGDFFVTSVNQKVVFQFKKGAATSDESYWGERIATTLAEVEGARSGVHDGGLSELGDAFVEGITDSLDEISSYASPTKERTSRNRRNGKSGTLNITVERGDGGLFLVGYVHSIDLRESGALRRGDKVLSIDGTVIQPLTEPEVMRLLDGEIGSVISLSVLRDGTMEPLTLTLRREEFGVNSVAARAEGKTLRIIMTKFNDPGDNGLKELLLRHSRESDSMGIILDLRGNPGGLLHSAVESADEFLSKGPIATIHGRHKDSHQYFKSKPQPLGKQPMVVLVDEWSASGAEIVTSALQENGRALVVGNVTFGSGTVQTVKPLPNAGALLLTWGEVLTAGYYRLDKRGVMPTVCTGGNATYETVLAELRSGSGTIDYTIRTQDFNPTDTGAIEAFRALCPPRGDGVDVSLEVARAILEDPALYDDLLTRSGQETAAAN